MKQSQTSDINWKALGVRVKEMRKRRGYTIDKLSTCIDVTSNFLSRIEGDNAHASLTTLYRIARELECSIGYFLCDSMEHLSNTQLAKLKHIKRHGTNLYIGHD